MRRLVRALGHSVETRTESADEYLRALEAAVKAIKQARDGDELRMLLRRTLIKTVHRGEDWERAFDDVRRVFRLPRS